MRSMNSTRVLEGSSCEGFRDVACERFEWKGGGCFRGSVAHFQNRPDEISEDPVLAACRRKLLVFEVVRVERVGRNNFGNDK
jgi:hypothetical protein